MRDKTAYGNQRNFLLLSQRPRQQGVGTAVLDKHRFAIVDKRAGEIREPPLEREIVHHAGFHVVAVERYSKAVSAAQIALLFEKVKILTNGDF